MLNGIGQGWSPRGGRTTASALSFRRGLCSIAKSQKSDSFLQRSAYASRPTMHSGGIRERVRVDEVVARSLHVIEAGRHVIAEQNKIIL